MDNKAKFLFNRIPTRLLRAHTLLDNIDRGLLEQIASWYPNDCFYSVNYLTEVVLGCGEKAFYRSIYKLRMLGLIEFKRGNRKKPNHYIFVADPSCWKLPTPLSQLIQTDHIALGFGKLVYGHEPFPNELGFKLAFNSSYPKHKIKLKISSTEAKDISPRKEDLNPIDREWFNRYDILISEHITNSKIIADYFKYKNELLKINIEDNGLSDFQKKYLLELKDKFDQLSKSPDCTDTLNLLKLANELDNDGNNAEEIYFKIRAEAKRQRDKKAEI